MNWLKIQLEFHRRKVSQELWNAKVQSLIWKVFKPQTSEDKFLGEISHWLQFDI